MTAFRDYESAADGVVQLYKTNHTRQTLKHVLEMKEQLATGSRRPLLLRLPPLGVALIFWTHKADQPKGFGEKLSLWAVLQKLDTLVDESDPDTANAQTQHALQSAEKARRDGQPRWMILACLIHDLGKMLCLHGYEQWTVVGDTFPVGCAFSQKIVYSEFFEHNEDSRDPKLNTKYGIYAPNCGLMHVHMSYGHDEYLWSVIKEFVPFELAYVIRFHSFYPWHREGAYQHLLNETDRQMLPHILEFNKYDLYSKTEALVDIEAVKPFYEQLIAEFFPPEILF
ncbi:hypothetical protein BC830DRAFT_1130140 [Chytriomyces sp. MP71]|nr:hypothetical protein BC830DRAFT_1130140 [Chytriomyces sp. MP71]